MDPSNIAIIIQTALFMATVIGAFFAIKYGVTALTGRLDRTDANLENVQVELRGLADILRTQAVQNLRIDHVEKRMDTQAALLDDLRRGEGFIFPIADAMKKRQGK